MLASLLGLDQPARRSRLENPALSLSDPDAWDEVFGQSETDAGIRFGHDNALKYGPVWQAVSLISGDVAKLPLDIYRRLPEGGREKDKSHPSFRLVRRRANPDMSAFRFWRLLMVHALIWGNGYAFIDRDGRGDALGLYPLLPDRTKPQRIGGELYFVTETKRRDGSPWLRPIPQVDVFHLQGVSVDGMRGCDLVDQARDSWALGLAAQKFASRFFKSGGRAGGVLEVPINTTAEYQDNLEKGFRNLYESDNGWFKTVVLRDGAKFHGAAFNAGESQMTETREEQALEVCRWFNLPPSKLGIPGSVSYNSQSESNQAYLDSTLDPWLTDMTQEGDEKLLSDAQIKADSHYLEHNVGKLLRMNPLQQAQVNAIAIRGGWRNADEAREMENRNPLPEGQGQKFVPVAQAKPAGGADKGENDKPRGPAQPVTDDETGGDENARHARRRVIFSLGAQARHKARNPRAWEAWLDGNLVSHRAEATELLGDDALVEQVLLRLKPTVESVGVQDLPAAVDRLITEFERAA